MMGLSIW
jgi:ankyrin repeat protein